MDVFTNYRKSWLRKQIKRIDNRIREYGEAATYEIQLHPTFIDLMKIMESLGSVLRTDRILRHSIEVAKLAEVSWLANGEKMQPLPVVQDSFTISGKAIDREVGRPR